MRHTFTKRLDARGEAGYFLPSGTWPDEDCLQSIELIQHFYINCINETGQLALVFEKYHTAPGSMVTPKFTIPTGMLVVLPAQPFVLWQGGVKRVERMYL